MLPTSTSLCLNEGITPCQSALGVCVMLLRLYPEGASPGNRVFAVGQLPR